ncbi:tumor necrosis factor receptor superfamily member 5-like [Paramormyrops kingsleyae]|uniref:tumor necrosis factor receptor superfamily member 5-like n=1 Tax=Paramormyrops kingsleyae TaxID=1676925 RepID=UPI003B96AC3B
MRSRWSLKRGLSCFRTCLSKDCMMCEVSTTGLESLRELECPFVGTGTTEHVLQCWGIIYRLKETQTFVIYLLCYHFCCSCDQDEYEINGICCRKCSPGSRVSRHCTKSITGHCAPCLDSTFSEKPNALNECHPCTFCAEDCGLKTVRECTPSSDTVCGVLEGHYCIDRYGEGCREAKEHTTCQPGQSVRPGTGYNDTVCEACSDHSYSNGSFTSCKPHTDCASRGLVTIKYGNHSSDSQCGEWSWVPVIAGKLQEIQMVIEEGFKLFQDLPLEGLYDV